MRALPKGWAEVELGEVWHESRARARPDAITRTDYIGLEHVEGGTNRITGAGRSDGVKSAVAVFSEGDVLYGRLRPYLNKVIRPSFAGVASTEFLVFKESQALVNGLLMRLLSSSDLVAYASANSAGVNLPRISAKRLAEYRFGLAPLPEQHRIVAKIESLFARLDEGVAALKRAETNLERYRASVLKAAVEGRLTEEWRRENPPAETGEDLLRRILAERRKRWEAEQLAKFEANGRKPPRNWRAKYKEPVAPDTSGLRGLPEGWCWATVDQVGKVGSGITKGGKKRDAIRRAVPYLRVANVQRGRLDLRVIKTIFASDAEIRRYSLKSGDVLFNEGGDRDKLGRGWVWSGGLAECLHQNHVFRVRPFLRDYPSEFLSHYGNSAGQEWFFRRATQSVNLASINQTVLRSLPVPLPPLREQQHIVRRLADELGSAEAAGTEFTRQLSRATILRQSILKSAFEGRLVPQDPADEPASVLVDRIRAERAAERNRRKRRPSQRKRQPKSRVP
ncbi:MAG: hypothetical protein F4Z72_00545 [Gemmatimonadales bacterium]|nr:hypothetical protein [Candidatus Palauibacter irciniicola]MYC19057.1 hypothetical protein [Gemmatimonadales bacterium]